ncbi:MAG: hypothetical protein AAF851_08530 [Myxococcota bacterium]
MLAPILLGLLATPQLVSAEDPSDWLELRAADHFAQALDQLGLPLIHPRAGPKPKEGEAFMVQVGPHDGEPTALLSVTVTFRDQRHELKASARRLASAGQDLAILVARSLGLQFEAEGWQRTELPWPVERRIGQARQRELQGKWAEASLAYERAASIPGGPWWAALDGIARCRSSLRPELAQAAAARARVATRNKAWPEASRAWASVLKYTPSRGLAWVVPGDFGDWRPAGADVDTVYGEAAGRGIGIRIGPARAEARRVPRPFVAAAPEIRIQGEGGGRLHRAGRWTRSLDFEPRDFRMLGGHLAAWTSTQLQWLDPSSGRSVGALSGPILGVGPRGALVRRGPAVALVRPGQEAPAWKQAMGETQAVAVTGERIVLLVGPRLLVLRGRDGKLVYDEAHGEGSRILSAAGRHAVLAKGERFLVVDILGGRLLLDGAGPSRAVAGLVRTTGAALAFETGDLMLFDEEGALTHRTRWPFPIRGMDRRPEHPQLLLIWTDEALFGVDDPSPGEDGVGSALLALARAQLEAGDRKQSLRLATAAARRALGPVPDAERLRAELLPEGPAREWAEERARSVERLDEEMMLFRVLGAPRPVEPLENDQSTTTEAED